MFIRIAFICAFFATALLASSAAYAGGTHCVPVGQATCDIGHVAIAPFLCTSTSGYSHLKYFAVASC